MICQNQGLSNTQCEVNWKVSLKDSYEETRAAVWNRTITFSIAESGEAVKRDDYILYGTYARQGIHDIQLIEDESGNPEYREIIVTDLRIQRIQIRSTKETHALLIEWFVPYEGYSIRYILYHLCQYFNQDVSIETYCGQQDFDERTFKAWLTWMKQHITILRQLGLTSDRKERRQILKQWTEEIRGGFHNAQERSLRLLKLGLYQRHRMPDHSKRQIKNDSG